MRDEMLWGVATAAYQVEGGLNGDGEPHNNWAEWDRLGRVEPCGDALGFWSDPVALLDRAASVGANAFRLSVEWARVHPSPGPHGALPEPDPAALDRYAEIIGAARQRGLEPVVTLHHFTHPAWLGADLWLRPDSPAVFERFVRACVAGLGSRLALPVRWWVTVNEPAVLAVSTYFLGAFPGAGWGIRRTATALDNLIAGHVRAYDAVHDVHAANGWTEPMVSTNSYCLTAVDLDAVLVDLLLARERAVPRRSLTPYLRRCRSRARRRVAAAARRGQLAVFVDACLHGLGRLGEIGEGGAAAQALYGSPRARKLDYISIDLYDPVAGHQFGPASGAAARLRTRRGVAELWEQTSTPSNMALFLRQAHLQAPGRPILVAENGMCTPGMRARPDGQRRDDYLRATCAEVVRARDEGIAVAGYLHWSIADNYEWGSYRPRFGLFGVDRTNGVRIMDTDASGVDAASVYAEVIRSSGASSARHAVGGEEA